MGKNIKDIIHIYEKTRDKTDSGFNQYIRSAYLFLDVAYTDMKPHFSQKRDNIMNIVGSSPMLLMKYDDNKIKMMMKIR